MSDHLYSEAALWLCLLASDPDLHLWMIQIAPLLELPSFLTYMPWCRFWVADLTSYLRVLFDGISAFKELQTRGDATVSSLVTLPLFAEQEHGFPELLLHCCRCSSITLGRLLQKFKHIFPDQRVDAFRGCSRASLLHPTCETRPRPWGLALYNKIEKIQNLLHVP